MNLTIVKEICREFEGLRLSPYLCPAGIPTIGYGSTFYENGSRVTLQDARIDPLRAETLLDMELRQHVAPAVARLCPGLLSDEKKFNAVCDFTYNLGAGRLQTSTLRRRINAGDWESVQSELMRWVRGGGKILPGLLKRRQVEAQLFLSQK